jgi:hypothetical protein
MKEVATFKVVFKSPTGECSDALEERFQEFERNLEYWAKKVCEGIPDLVVETDAA